MHRILQVFNQYLESGGEEVWVNQVAELCNGRHAIDELRFLSKEWMRRDAPTRFTQARRLWDNPASRDRLRAAVANSSPDVLLYHNLIPVGSLGLYDEAARIGLPVVQYLHNFRPFSPSGTLWVRGKVNPASLYGNPWPEVLHGSWENSVLKTFLVASYQKHLLASDGLDNVKRWIAVSDFVRDRFIDGGLAPERVIALRHCWKPEATTDPDRMGKHYLFLGRLVPEKGVLTMIRAWRILEERLGASCPRLVIAGTGPLERTVHRMASKMRRVVCVGFAEGIAKAELLHSCRALIAPSIWWEPLGLIIYEAYDYGRPVLSARSGGLSEIVFPGETGFVHEPDNAEALADDVERMEALGPTRRAEMGIAGRDWLLANASPKEWLERFTRIIGDVTN